MKNRLFSRIPEYAKLLRINSWPKNFFVFVAAVFAKRFFEGGYFTILLEGFITFSIASSAVYILNDLADASKDAIHPEKKNRPIASGSISKASAVVTGLLLLGFVLFMTFQLHWPFMKFVWIYIFINILYSTYLKNIVIVDIFCIASGFMLRVIAGAYLISVDVSNWLILTTIFLSLFLAVMKRRVEIASTTNAKDQRSVLNDYSLSFTDQIGAITGSSVIFSYALYSVSDRTVKVFGSDNLVYTTLFVIFGIFRYMYIVYKKNKGENVIEVVYTDFPSLLNLFLYGVMVIYIIYFHKFM